eukprot:2338746-Pleurochrysis_carterae.AAC.5
MRTSLKQSDGSEEPRRSPLPPPPLPPPPLPPRSSLGRVRALIDVAALSNAAGLNEDFSSTTKWKPSEPTSACVSAGGARARRRAGRARACVRVCVRQRNCVRACAREHAPVRGSAVRVHEAAEGVCTCTCASCVTTQPPSPGGFRTFHGI